MSVAEKEVALREGVETISAEDALIVELSGRIHVTSSDVPDVKGLDNIIEQERDRGSPVDSEDVGGSIITDVGACSATANTSFFMVPIHPNYHQ